MHYLNPCRERTMLCNKEIKWLMHESPNPSALLQSSSDVTSREIRPPIYLSSQAALAQLLHAVLEKGKADRCTGAGVTPIQPAPRVVVVVVVHSATIREEGEDYCANELRSFLHRFIMEAKVKLLLAICRPSEGRIMRMGSMAAQLLQSQSVIIGCCAKIRVHAMSPCDCEDFDDLCSKLHVNFD